MEIIQHNLFDGKVCRDCKQWKSYPEFFKKRDGRDGFYTRCKECWHAYTRAWRKQNPEATQRSRLRFVKNNPDKVRGYHQKYRQTHPEKIKQQQERERLYKKVEKCVRRRRWYHNNIDKIRTYRQRRRGRKIGNGGSYTADEWIALCEKYNYLCLACGQRRPLTVDHVIPLSKGGNNTIDNIQPLCKPCNSTKHDKYIDYRPK